MLRPAMRMVAGGNAIPERGNHEEKLVRALRGRNVQADHGPAQSPEQPARETPEFRAEAPAFCDALVPHYVLDGGRLVIAHAGLPERHHGRESARMR